MRRDEPARAQESAQHEQEPAAEEAEAPTPAVALRRNDLPAQAQESAQHEQESAAEEAEAPTPAVALRRDEPARAQESAQHEQEPAAEEAEAPTPAVALRRDDLPARAQEPEIAPIAPAPTAAPPTPTAAHVSSVGDDQEMTVELLGLMLEAALPSPGPLSEPESCLLVSADGDNLLTLFDAAASSALQCMHCCEVMPTIEELKAHEEECEDGICLHCKEPWYTKRAKARQQLVACDACNGWLHLSCTPYKSLKQATDDGYFSCNACAQANKPPEMPSGARQASCQYTSDTDTDSDTWA